MSYVKSPAPHGAGGLKWYFVVIDGGAFPSRPARGGWIEMFIEVLRRRGYMGPAPHGAGGLKFFLLDLAETSFGVPPRTGRVD